jgi:hypothetical protein
MGKIPARSAWLAKVSTQLVDLGKVPQVVSGCSMHI